MSQISEHINSSNQKSISYDQTRKFIINLGSKQKKKMTPPHPNSPIYIISDQHWINPFQEVQQYYLVINYIDG